VPEVTSATYLSAVGVFSFSSAIVNQCLYVIVSKASLKTTGIAKNLMGKKD
jgi:hypothetical protein